jgi:hypothetical protein
VSRQWVTAQVSVLVSEGEDPEEAQADLEEAIIEAAKACGYSDEEIA